MLAHCLRPLARGLAVVALIAAAAIIHPATTQAQDIKHIGSFGDWNAFVGNDGDTRFCWIASAPQKKEGKYTKRGDVRAMVTRRDSGGKMVSEVSFYAGYTFKPGSEVTVKIGSNTFKLFTKGGTAWARDSKTDARIIAAMKAGRNMVVQGTSSRGTLTTDTYSLIGVTAGLSQIGKSCK